jgi:hypothetical protein
MRLPSPFAVFAAHMLNMTTSQNRQPKGITAGGQFAPDTHAESTLLLDRAARDVVLSPGDGDTFSELADGDVIETLNVSRSDDGSGYWISPAKTVNIKKLITDSDPRLHGDTLDSWLETNGAVIEDFLAERYQADITADEGWDETGVECTAQLPEGSLTEAQIVDAAWHGTKVVQLHNESDHGSFGSENLGRLIIERVDSSTVLADPYTSRAAGLRIDQSELDAILDDGRRSPTRLPLPSPTVGQSPQHPWRHRLPRCRTSGHPRLPGHCRGRPGAQQDQHRQRTVHPP